MQHGDSVVAKAPIPPCARCCQTLILIQHSGPSQEADACGARIEYIDQEQSVTVRRISESFKMTVRMSLQSGRNVFMYARTAWCCFT